MFEINKNDKWRLGLHLMPPDGWLNDPNGLCQFQGKYHVFFQYTPHNPQGGMKYWGHYTSTDLLAWSYDGIALSPSETFDSHGVYSGSGIVVDGKMNLFYTGNVKLQGDYDYVTDGRQGNTVLVSSEDGVNFSEKKCLMTNADYPEHLTCHVRDPKVVSGESIGQEHDSYYMFLGARTKADTGEVLVYRSKHMEQWELCNILKSEEPFGYMWECPDAFVLGETKILGVSPQGVEANGVDYQNIYQSGYYRMEGQFDGEYSLTTFKEWDRGFDFYAPQTFLDDQGRRILIGWIGMPDDPKQSNPTVEQGWQNALTVPREVFMKKGKVMQYPVEELLKLRENEMSLECGLTTSEMAIYDVEIKVQEESDLQIMISEGIHLEYSKCKKQFSLIFDETMNLGCGRSARAVNLDVCSSVRILADTSCLEVYVNGGEEVFTTRFYTETGTSSFSVLEGASEIKYWELKSMNI